MRLVILATSLMLFCTISYARRDGFHIASLPMGKDITLPKPAITYVPVTGRVTLESTDLPQTVKLSTVNISRGRRAKPIEVAIYDANSPRVKYVTLKPGTSYMYTFKTLGKISVVPKAPRKTRGRLSNYSLRVESNKPMGIAR